MNCARAAPDRISASACSPPLCGGNLARQKKHRAQRTRARDAREIGKHGHVFLVAIDDAIGRIVVRIEGRIDRLRPQGQRGVAEHVGVLNGNDEGKDSIGRDRRPWGAPTMKPRPVGLKMQPRLARSVCVKAAGAMLKIGRTS